MPMKVNMCSLLRSNYSFINAARSQTYRLYTTHNSTEATDARRLKTDYDAIVVGAGHNGLVAAAYLGKAGLNVCVLERRHIVGGAAVTEEIVPGFKFSRASYVLSLLEPQIVTDLELKKHGLKVYRRNPHSYTPISDVHRLSGGSSSLTLYSEIEKSQAEIAKFSRKDAQLYPKYEQWLNRIVSAIEPLMNSPPPDCSSMLTDPLWKKLTALQTFHPLYKTGKMLGSEMLPFYDLLTSSVTKILNQWFESDVLKATLAMDGVIGSLRGPDSAGTGYILLHHCMGEIDGVKGAWGYPEGGMGAVTQAMNKAALQHGVHLTTSTNVKEILVEDDGKVKGVCLENGISIKAKCVLSNATPSVTFLDLLPEGVLSDDQLREIKRIDYSSPVTKINLALNSLPNFTANPNVSTDVPMPHHQTTIHLNCENTAVINEAYLDALQGKLPQNLDPTLSTDGCHVCLLFTQYTPYNLKGTEWNEATKKDYLNIVIKSIEQYDPHFGDRIIGGEVLSPVDLEKIFNLTGGNIFHGALSLDQLYFTRPLLSVASPRTHVPGLYLCGSGAHPGGGVMGSPGKLTAAAVLNDLKTLKRSKYFKV